MDEMQGEDFLKLIEEIDESISEFKHNYKRYNARVERHQIRMLLADAEYIKDTSIS